MVVEECMFDPYVAHANNYIQPCPAHEMTCKDIAQSKAVFLTVILSPSRPNKDLNLMACGDFPFLHIYT